MYCCCCFFFFFFLVHVAIYTNMHKVKEQTSELFFTPQKKIKNTEKFVIENLSNTIIVVWKLIFLARGDNGNIILSNFCQVHQCVLVICVSFIIVKI